jgi:hypothetical protein
MLTEDLEDAIARRRPLSRGQCETRATTQGELDGSRNQAQAVPLSMPFEYIAQRREGYRYAFTTFIEAEDAVTPQP